MIMKYQISKSKLQRNSKLQYPIWRFDYWVFFGIWMLALGALSCRAATVLIPLQTCGISPAADRSITLTPLQALGSNSIPVMDKIQGATDANGNWSATLLPGVYQADVRPVWGAVGVTEFYFCVDPSNAVQNAFANLLTGTNNTYPPNQYAYTAQASDERYVLASSGTVVEGTLTNNTTGWAAAATNANNLGGFPAQYYSSQLPIGTPMPILWLTAETFADETNLTPVIIWPDASGNGNNFYACGANDYFIDNGYPSIWSSGTINGASPWGLVCTNFFKNYPSLNTTAFTILFVVQNDPSDYNASANNFAAILGAAGINSSGTADGLQFSSYALDNSVIGGAVTMFSHGATTWAICDARQKYHAILFNWNGQYLNAWEDGLPTMQGSIAWTDFSSVSYLGATNNFYLFNQAPTGVYPWIGWMAECLVWSNNLTAQQCQNIDRAFAKKYDENNRMLVLDGDSIMQSNHAWDNGSETGQTIDRLVANLLPQWDVVCAAVGGRDSLGVLTNQIVWQYAKRNSAGPNIVVSDLGAVNDVLYGNAPNGVSMTAAQASAQLPLTETNAINFCAIAHTNGFKVLMTTLVSGFWETNGFKTNYNNWLRANSNFCDGIVDWGATALGTNGAYANTTIFYSDQLHPNWLGAQMQASNIFNIISTNIW